MKRIVMVLASASILLGGCMYEPVHQGNRLNADKVLMVQQGQTRFKVEQLLGSPILDNKLHPNRVTYYEEFEDDQSGDLIKRGVEVTYDDALRVKDIRRFGFDTNK